MPLVPLHISQNGCDAGIPAICLINPITSNNSSHATPDHLATLLPKHQTDVRTLHCTPLARIGVLRRFPSRAYPNP